MKTKTNRVRRQPTPPTPETQAPTCRRYAKRVLKVPMTAREEALIDTMELAIKPVRRKDGMVLVHVELPPFIFPIMDRACRRAKCNREQFILRAIKARLDAIEAGKASSASSTPRVGGSKKSEVAS